MPGVRYSVFPHSVVKLKRLLRKLCASSTLVAAATLSLAVAVPTSAQTVAGTLIHKTAGVPVIGAYVVLLDDDSLEVARGLTDARGRFTVHAPRPGSYRLRTEQIGLQSFVSSPIELTGSEVEEIELLMQPVIVRLDPLSVEGDARECRVIGEQALQVQTVWEEARKALTAVAWTDPQDQLIHEVERFERWFSRTMRLVHESRETVPSRNVMPFRSRSISELEEFGYVLLLEDSVVYEAPDAEVFFSAPFLQHHCFALAEKREGGRDKVGLAFEPLVGRTRPDVKGVFWLDRESGTLEDLELSYVNVGVWQRERGAAGELEFQQLPDGRWFVSSWWIRMPVVRRRESKAGAVWNFPEAVVGFKQDGGEVSRVYSADGRTLFARERATVSGVVTDSTTGTWLEGAYVRLVGTARVTVSDVAGGYWLTDLPDGRYAVAFEHPRAAFLGLSDRVGEQEVRLRSGEVARVNLALPSPETLVRRLCTEPTEVEQGLLVGRIRDAARDTTVVGAQVRVAWVVESAEGATQGWVETVSDAAGVYRACVPKGAPLSVEVTADGFPLTAVPVMLGERVLQELDIELRERESSSIPRAQAAVVPLGVAPMPQGFSH